MYSNTLGIHYKYYKIIEECNVDEPLLYAYSHFTRMVDLLFAFNSFLVGYCVITKIIDRKTAFPHRATNPFNFNKNIFSILKIIESFKTVSKQDMKKIKIFETYFRNSYAHGKFLNLISTALFTETIFVIFLKGEQQEMRVCISNEDFLRFKEQLTYDEKINNTIQ